MSCNIPFTLHAIVALFPGFSKKAFCQGLRCLVHRHTIAALRLGLPLAQGWEREKRKKKWHLPRTFFTLHGALLFPVQKNRFSWSFRCLCPVQFCVGVTLWSMLGDERGKKYETSPYKDCYLNLRLPLQSTCFLHFSVSSGSGILHFVQRFICNTWVLIGSRGLTSYSLVPEAVNL